MWIFAFVFSRKPLKDRWLHWLQSELYAINLCLPMFSNFVQCIKKIDLIIIRAMYVLLKLDKSHVL